MSFSKSTIQSILLWALAFLSIFLIFSNVDGDLSVLRRHGDYGDEGYWIQNAFNKVKHGLFLTDDQAQGYFGAPLFTFLLTGFVKIFGATLYYARLFSILVTLLSACLLWLLLKKTIKNTVYSSLLVVLFLSLPETKLYGAWCSPITLEWLFSIVYLYWVVNHPLINFKNIFVAAIIILLNILSKSTSIYLIGVFVFQMVFDFAVLKQKSKKTILIYVIISAVLLYISYTLIQMVLKSNYPIEHSQFKQLIKWNLNFKKGFIDLFSETLNPLFWTTNIIGILKYTSGLLILMIFVWSIKSGLSKINYRFKEFKSLQYWANHRQFAVFALLFFTYWFFLLIIGQTGFDRRVVAQIPILFFGVGLALRNIEDSWYSTKRWKIFGAIITIIIFCNQAIDMFNSGSIFYMPLFAFAVLSAIGFGIFVISSKPTYAIFYIVLVNCMSTHIFRSKTHQLSELSTQLSNFKSKYNVKYIVGYHSHHLASNNNIIPIWYQKKLVNWNQKFPLFGKDYSTLVVASLNDPEKSTKDEVFLTIKDLDKNTIILDSMDIQYQRMLMFNQSSKKTKFENEKLRFYVVRSR